MSNFVFSVPVYACVYERERVCVWVCVFVHVLLPLSMKLGQCFHVLTVVYTNIVHWGWIKGKKLIALSLSAQF